MIKKYKNLFLVLIILVAAVLRLWQIGAVPLSPDWDEAALGYNAYTLLHTGRDEYGTFLPVVLKSFGDYKPALYAYLIIPFIKFFGLNLISVRLPSVIFGIITVAAVYYLAKLLFEREDVALLSALLLAISPWHIQFSRVAFETNVGLALNVLMALSFVYALKKPRFFVLAGFFGGLSIYSYQSEKIFTPLLLFALVTIFYKQLIRIPKKYLAAGFLVLFFVGLPMALNILTNHETLERAGATSVFAHPGDVLRVSSQKLEQDRQTHNLIGFVLDNRRVEFVKAVIGGYLSHFNLNWLFITGDLPRHHAPFMGLLYLWELPFLLIGLYIVFFNTIKVSSKARLLLFAWFLLAPVPASFTNDVPHAVRTMNFLPTFQVFTAFGILISMKFISSSKYQIAKIQIKYVIFTLFFLFLIFNILYYFNQYFVQQNYFYAKDWQYGYAQVVPAVSALQKDYKHIVISDKVPMDQSYIFFLYYLQYPPEKYQKERGENHSFSKYSFRPIEWTKDQTATDTLFVGSANEFPNEVHPKKIVYYPDGTAAMKIVERK